MEALNYINHNFEKLKQDPVRYEKIKKNFINNYEKPLDKAWEELSKEEKEKLMSLYLFRKSQQIAEVKKMIDTFGGHLVSFTEPENKK